MLVVDSSVAIKWYVAEPESERAAELIGTALGAPDLIIAEVANALWTKVRRREIGHEQARSALPKLRTSIAFITPVMSLADRALEFGLELSHPVYDCFFLAFADVAGTQVVTADERLLRRCAGTRFEAFVRRL